MLYYGLVSNFRKPLHAHNPLWRQTGKYREVRPTPEEVQGFKDTHSGHSPTLKLLACDCGKRIWGSGIAIGSHERACPVGYNSRQLRDLIEARRQGIASTYGQLLAKKQAEDPDAVWPRNVLTRDLRLGMKVEVLVNDDTDQGWHYDWRVVFGCDKGSDDYYTVWLLDADGEFRGDGMVHVSARSIHEVQ